MVRSSLPPIVWVASCGHRNEVRSDHGGYPAKCKTCKVSVWVPKRGAGRASSAREAAGRFGARRREPAAPPRPGRPAAPAPRADPVARYLAENLDQDDLPDYAAGLETQTALVHEVSARMADDIMRLARRQPPGGAAREGAVIPPQPSPPGGAAPDLPGRQPAAATLIAGGGRTRAQPQFGGNVVPRDPALAPPCMECQVGPRRSAAWTRASWQVAVDRLMPRQPQPVQHRPPFLGQVGDRGRHIHPGQLSPPRPPSLRDPTIARCSPPCHQTGQ